MSNAIDVDQTQRVAWQRQITILRDQLASDPRGDVHFEFAIPRVGRRADVVLVKDAAVFVVEFKVGSSNYGSLDIRQAHGYAVDLKNFHGASESVALVPVLVCTAADTRTIQCQFAPDGVALPLLSNGSNLGWILANVANDPDHEVVDADEWARGSYRPTPTIVEAAQYLYANHSVAAIAQSGAAAENLSLTTRTIQEIVSSSRARSRKSICFVTGVPGSGKTLAGLNIATVLDYEGPQSDPDLAVFLSGNGPLVAVLREALARDSKGRDETQSITDARRRTERFIQNVHHFRDETLRDDRAPVEKVAVFDEAQRAWDLRQTAKFMSAKKGIDGFDMSEPEFLMSVMDRHEDWCVIVALVGGGQELNTGETGLGGWFSALDERFAEWDVYYSGQISQPAYDGGDVDFGALASKHRVSESHPGLHLSTSMRSFRADHLSHLVHYLIQNEPDLALSEYEKFRSKYEIFVSRDIQEARDWLVSKDRGSETRGMLASSGGMRLRPYGIHVKNELEPEHWFLDGPYDIRSSHLLEVIATEFDVQGLELDWCLVGWDGDLRHNGSRFEHWQFKGTKWQQRGQMESRKFLENAYRVLLTRARQGMVIFVPAGDALDPTRPPSYYDDTYDYLMRCGLTPLGHGR
ncbi:DUF2075 domain-containing protein [Cryobacterium sp. Sr8]|uniref:DUF2075 domain-containing protein n=1 Tax=Cryobacterium sp. Sr8 TaxID=1259203 RepID=UPI0018E0C01B|nr:DUF2075 domain-containing protein [Cryobacterium sp. Sr8]